MQDLMDTVANDKNRLGVYIIESLSADDLLVERSWGSVLRSALDSAGILCWYKLAVNASAFRKAISGMRSLDEDGYCVPVLHISCHGLETGLQLACGGELSWDDLALDLVGINQHFNNSLLLCLSSCYGLAAQKMTHAGGVLPYFALVGNEDRVAWHDALVGYLTLYHLSAAKGYTIAKAVETMKLASGDDRFELSFGESTQKDWQQQVSTRWSYRFPDPKDQTPD